MTLTNNNFNTYQDYRLETMHKNNWNQGFVVCAFFLVKTYYCLVHDWPISAGVANVDSLLIGGLTTRIKFSETEINTLKTFFVMSKTVIYRYFFPQHRSSGKTKSVKVRLSAAKS